MNSRIVIAISFLGLNLMACCGGGCDKKPAQDGDVKQNQTENKERWKPIGDGSIKQGEFSHTETASVDGVQVSLLSAKIDKLLIKPPEGKEHSAGPFLVIRFRVANDTQDFICQYTSLSANRTGPSRTSLVDESKNTYPLFTDARYAADAVDTLKSNRFGPGQTFEDLVAFEVPLERSKTFRLTLSGAALGKSEKQIVFTIPRSFFENK